MNSALFKKSLLGIFVAPKPQVHCPQNGWICWRSKWRNGRKSDRHIDILEMHISQRTIYAPTKTNIDMEEKKWIEFREKIDLKSKTM